MNNKFRTVRGYELLNNKKITPAMEDYLEMIYRNNYKNKSIRPNELAKLLNVTNSSVTKMVKRLEDLKLLEHEKYGDIKLTKEGDRLGSFFLERHLVIEKFLTIIGIKNNILIETELMEHALSPDTINNIKKLNKFLEISNYDKHNSEK